METCQNCGQPIRISIFKGTAWCSEDCRKALLEKTQKIMKVLRPVIVAQQKINEQITQEEGLRVADRTLGSD